MSAGPIVQTPADTEERLLDEGIGAYTDRIARLGGNLGIRRQCSIGWHYECSDPRGDECRCACHPERQRARALPLPENPGYYVDRDLDPWELTGDGRWLFGADDAADPHDSAPFIPLRPLHDTETALIIEALQAHAAVVGLIKHSSADTMRALAARLHKEVNG